MACPSPTNVEVEESVGRDCLGEVGLLNPISHCTFAHIGVG